MSKRYEVPPVVETLEGNLLDVARQFKQHVAGIQRLPVPHPITREATNHHFVLDPSGRHIYAVASRQYAAFENLTALAHPVFERLHTAQGTLHIGPKVFGRFYTSPQNPDALPTEGVVYLNSFDRNVSERLILPGTLVSISLKHFHGNTGAGMGRNLEAMGELMGREYRGLMDVAYPLHLIARDVLNATLMADIFDVHFDVPVTDSAVKLTGADKPTPKMMAAELRRFGYDDTLGSLVRLTHKVVNHRLAHIGYKSSFSGHSKVLDVLVAASEVVNKHALFGTF